MEPAKLPPEIKTFKVTAADGSEFWMKQLATFTWVASGVGSDQRVRRFVVTQSPTGEVGVTHRESGSGVVRLDRLSGPDWARAGKAGLDALVKQRGAARVCAVFRAAEGAPL